MELVWEHVTCVCLCVCAWTFIRVQVLRREWQRYVPTDTNGAYMTSFKCSFTISVEGLPKCLPCVVFCFWMWRICLSNFPNPQQLDDVGLFVIHREPWSTWCSNRGGSGRRTSNCLKMLPCDQMCWSHSWLLHLTGVSKIERQAPRSFKVESAYLSWEVASSSESFYIVHKIYPLGKLRW